VIFRKIAALSDTESQAAITLYLNYYDSSDEMTILSDLKKKTEILLLYHHNELVGFTTFELYEHLYKGVEIEVIYSGDTIVHHEHWGQQALAYAWIRRIGQLKSALKTKPLYWFLIVKGHRTYKYLPTFAKSFYPHWSVDRSDLKALLDELAGEKFGQYYNAQTGLIVFESSKGHLKEAYVHPSEKEQLRDAVSFFLKRNPKYYRGDELACLCEVNDTNMRPLTKRIARTGAQRLDDA